MTHKDIVAKLSLTCPNEPIFVITTRAILLALVQRLGDKALDLTPEDLESARDEVRAAIEMNLDEREYIEMGLDAWEIVRNL